MKKLSYTALMVGFIGCQAPQEQASQGVVIDTVELAKHVKVLASDEFEGRKPFTEGETRTINYLKEQFRSYGLDPGNGDSYFQPVPLVELSASPSEVMTFSGAKGSVELTVAEDFVAFSERVEDQVSLAASEVVFAGYGIVAPEYDWNDYEGLDVKGKTVIVLVNDPGFGSGDSTLFKGENMTYYGRWTYKYEEAARQGAAGIFIIHDTAPAGYPWLVVRNSWSGASLYLDQQEGTYKPAVQGWLTREAAIRVFEASGTDMRNYVERSRSEGFEAVELNMTASVEVTNDVKRDVSQNVIAKISGTKNPDEYLVYTAHWDHLGIGPEVDGDSIYNGAHDNASGTAALLAIARAFAQNEVKPERTVIFLAVTAEEQGLLGSQYYAENPIYPVEKTVANINMDGLNYYGLMKDFTIVGFGQSELDDIAGEIAESQGRYVMPDPEPGKGYFFRSDHFQFAKVGVPAIFASGTYESMDRGVEYIDKLQEDHLANRYHRPADELSTAWEFAGIQQDALLFYEMGWRLANSDEWPQWKPGSEFKSIREN